MIENLRKICPVNSTQCFFSVSGQPEEDPLERNQGKTPSMHDCTQILMVNRPGSILTMQILKLTLEVIDSVKMVIGTQYEIFPYGLKSSRRDLKDGCVYAGSLERSGSSRINDIILPNSERGIGKKHFMIQFYKGTVHIDKNVYAIKDLGEGDGTFIRLDKPLKIQDGFIISLGESHFIVRLESNNLNLNFIDGPRTGDTL
jgi:FHA domain